MVKLFVQVAAESMARQDHREHSGLLPSGPGKMVVDLAFCVRPHNAEHDTQAYSPRPGLGCDFSIQFSAAQLGNNGRKHRGFSDPV